MLQVSHMPADTVARMWNTLVFTALRFHKEMHQQMLGTINCVVECKTQQLYQQVRAMAAVAIDEVSMVKSHTDAIANIARILGVEHQEALRCDLVDQHLAHKGSFVHEVHKVQKEVLNINTRIIKSRRMIFYLLLRRQKMKY